MLWLCASKHAQSPQSSKSSHICAKVTHLRLFGALYHRDFQSTLSLFIRATCSRVDWRDGWRVFLMLCSRGPAADVVPDREIIREQLLNQRLSSLADIYLEELRSEAILVEK